jgi:hypothetical protein
MIHIADSGPKDDEQHSPQIVAPQMPPPHHFLAHSLDQQAHWMMVVQYMRYISHCFIQSVTFNVLGI